PTLQARSRPATGQTAQALFREFPDYLTHAVVLKMIGARGLGIPRGHYRAQKCVVRSYSRMGKAVSAEVPVKIAKMAQAYSNGMWVVPATPVDTAAQNGSWAAGRGPAKCAVGK